MKNLFLIFTIIILGLGAQAQVNMDSLWGVWNDESQCDTCRLKAINSYIHDGGLSRNNPDTAIILAKQEYDFAKKADSKYFMAKALNLQGNCLKYKGDSAALKYYNMSIEIYKEIYAKKEIAIVFRGIQLYYKSVNNYNKAIDYSNKSLDLSKEIGYKEGIINSLGDFGHLYWMQDNYVKAIHYFKQCLKIAEEVNDSRNIAMAQVNLGGTYNELNKYTMSINYYKQALSIFKKINHQEYYAGTLVNIGNMYFTIKNYPEALKYYKQSLKILEEINSKDYMAIVLYNIGLIYIDKGELSKAVGYLNQSLGIREVLNNRFGIPRVLNAIGTIYRKQMKYNKALENYKQALEISKEIKSIRQEAATYISIGNLHLKQNSAKEAVKDCKKALVLHSDIGIITGQKSACDCLYNAYKHLGKGDSALVYLEKMNILNDSLKKEETAKKLQQMEYEKEFLADSLLQVEEQLKIQHAHELEIQKKKRSRNIYIAIGIFILFIAIVLWSRLRYTRRAKGTIEKEKGRSDDLLLNILPAEIAEELKAKGEAKAAKFELVSILFTDFKGFTEISENLNSDELVSEINYCFKAFDAIIGKYKVEKIKTIGDSYMAAGGLPVPTADSVANTVKAALDMQAFITARKLGRTEKSEFAFEMRAGIHSGSVVAGIVGDKKFQYDIWGDAVNIASRIESHSDIGKVNISQTTYDLIKDNSTFTFESRGKISTKGKGEIDMFFVGYADY